MARRSVWGRAASSLGGVLDDALLGALSMRFQRRRKPDESRRVVERHDRRALLDEIIASYAHLDLFARRPAGLRLLADEERARLRGGVVAYDWKWQSGYEAAWPTVRDEYAAFAPNRYAYAHVWLQPRAAPAVICVHGYGGGRRSVEELAFPVRWLHASGLNVALLVLPFHGARGGGEAPVWPSVHVARTNEGFGQAVHDLRALRLFLEARGATETIVVGMSLGGYTSALYATCDPVALVAPMIPVASFPELLWGHGAGGAARQRAERDGITVDMLRQAMAGHTPIMRPPMVPPARALVLTAAGDRIAPPEHGAMLARHFGCDELRLAGGHLFQVWRGAAFRALGRRMGELGLWPEPR